MDKLAFITAAYDEIREICKDPLYADMLRGQVLIPHLHSRTTFLNSRAVTLRTKIRTTDYGIPAVFEDPLAALTFHNAVRCILKKMDPPIS